MGDVVREEPRLDRELAGIGLARGAPRQFDGVLAGHRPGGGDRPGERRAVGDEPQAVRQQGGERRPLRGREGRVREPRRIVELQLVGGVEVVERQPSGEAVRRDVDVEIAERRRVGRQHHGQRHPDGKNCGQCRNGSAITLGHVRNLIR